MATLMAQPGLAPNAPSTRQDVISALLDGYADSFGRGDSSPYAYSPVPALKELPPPPPSKDEKPLPPVMTMRFQLRVDEPQSPHSRNGSRTDSPTRIVSKSMSRNSKPPSLKLLASNGATAFTPPKVPTLPSKVDSPSTTSLPPRLQEERPLPSLPPPPPEKSERRQLSDMGNQNSREQKENVKRESKEDKKVERKPLPGLKKFVSLAELGKGPRAGKTAPAPAPAQRPAPPPPNTVSKVLPVPQEANANLTKVTEDPFKTPSLPANDSSSRKGSLGGENMLTQAEASGPPPQSPIVASTQVQTEPQLPSKKTFGLPSNPRAKGQETPSSMHIRGKSSTGFNLMKSAPKPASNTTTMTTLNTITPSPSPAAQSQTQPTGLAGAVQAQLRGPESPVSPLTPESQPGYRPFSFEAIPPAPSARPAQQQQPRIQQQVSPLPQPPKIQDPAVFAASPAPSIQQAPSPNPMRSSISPPPAAQRFPPRTTSRPGPESPVSPPPGAGKFPPRTTSRPSTSPHPIPFPSGPGSPTSQAPQAAFGRSSLPTPLPSRTPAPAIENRHRDCYIQHRTMMFSKNVKNPVACMACKQHATGPYHACSWCYLRVCERCCGELRTIPGRKLQVLLDKVQRRSEGADRQQEGANAKPSVVVWEPQAEGEDFS